MASGAGFYPSRVGYTPLSICLARNFGDSVEELLLNIMPRLQENPVSFYYLGPTMAKLNTFSSDCLHQLYELAFRKSLDKTMPQFCVGSVSLPILKESSKIFLPAESFLPLDKFQSEDKAIEFTQSYFKLNTITGSQESLDFVKSLVECKNLEIFTTLFIRTLIDNKWNKMRWIHYVDAFLYFVYLILICFTPAGHASHWVMIVPFVINQLLLLFEILQMVSSKDIYFSSPINYLDISRSLIFSLYCITEYYDHHEDSQALILLITIVLSLIRGFAYFRVFSATRWVIYLVIEVFYQLWAFIFVTAYTIVSLGIIYRIVTREYTDYDSDEFKLEWLMLFFIIIINPLIILNLFISIIGNALEKIKDERIVKEKQELAEMIFEAEILFYWRRNQQKKKFLHLCNEEQANVIVFNSISERIRNTSEKSEELLKIYNQNTTEIKMLKATFEEQFRDIEGKTDLMLEVTKNY